MKMRIIAVLLLLVSSYGFGQKIELFADLEKNEIDTELNFLTSFKGNIYFYEQTNGKNKGIYKTDGTEAGTILLKNLYNFNYSTCTGIYAGTNKLIFSSIETRNGGDNKLYVSDGTSEGTILIHQNYTERYLNFVENNGFIYFTIGTNALWKTDGTSVGTVLVKNNISASNFYSFNNTLYFVGHSSTTGYELWKTDGTDVSTKMIVDFVPGAGNGILPTSKIVMHQNNLYYTSGYSIIKMDMINETSIYFLTLTGAFDQKKEAQDILLKDNDLYISADGNYDGNLYKYNLTTHNLTRLLIGSSGFLRGLVLLNGDVYCNNTTNVVKTNGTPDGTVFLAHYYNSNGYFFNFNITGKVFNSFLYYLRYKIVGGKYIYALWKTNGTEAGNTFVKEYSYFSTYNSYLNYKLEENQGKLFFFVNDGINGREVHKSDGTTAGTSIVKNLGTPNINGGIREHRIAEFDGKFIIQSGNTTYALDTTMKTTKFITDMELDLPLFKYDNKIYLGGGYRIDGDLTGVENFCPYCYSPMLFQNKIFLSKYEELYSYDGTTFNLVKDINPMGSSSPTTVGVINNKLILTAYHPDYGRELWVSDGTSTGTHLIKDLIPGTSGISISKKFVYNNLVIFEIYNEKYELWRTDGTAEGTFCISTNLANNFNNYYGFIVFDNKCYFTTNRKICVTDGTLEQTKFVNGTYSDVNNLPYFSISNDKLYFIGLSKNSGQVIYSIKNGIVTPASNPLNRPAGHIINAKTLFAYDERSIIYTYEDYYSVNHVALLDTRDNKTTLLKSNLNLSFASSYFTKINNLLFFKADDKIHGDEFWVARFPKCQNELSIVTNYNNSTTKLSANYKISATNSISGGNLTYRSGEVISLNPGFKVEKGGVFKTEIGKCESY